MTIGGWTPVVSAVPLEEVLAVVSGAIAAVAALVGIWATAVGQRQTKAAVRRVDSTSPDAVLSSLDLEALGDYVYGTLGAIPISEYARDGTARHNVAAALREIERFVTEDEAAVPGEKLDETVETSLANARRALADGDTWQALARLRRTIEMDLRSRAERYGIEVPQRAGAGRLLQLLERANALPEESAGPLRYAVDVADRAIHGEPVSVAQADEALHTASRALAYPSR